MCVRLGQGILGSSPGRFGMLAAHFLRSSWVSLGRLGLHIMFFFGVCVCVCVCVRAPRSGDLRIVPWSIRDAGGPLFAFFLG